MTKSLNKIQEAVDSIDKLCKLLGVKDIIPLGRIVVDYYRDVLQHNGKRLATSQLKALYNEACYYVVGQGIKPSTPLWLKRNRKTNLPLILKPFGPYLLSKEVLTVRLTLSYLRVYESLVLEPVPDLATVISPSNGATGFQSFSSDFENFLKVSPWGKTIKKLYEDERSKTTIADKQYHYSAKGGVDGPAIGNAGKQSLAINDELLEIMCEIDKSFKIRDIKEDIRKNQEFYKDHDDIFKGKGLAETSLGRLAFLPDKGGKTRLIAIGNYWIQEILVGLHDTIYGVLGRLEQDGTYKQASSSEAVCKATLDTKVWSYDLTAATDRFPIEPQQVLLEFLDVNLANWSKLITSIGFDYKGKQYTYRVGQPMGLYSSWSTFALCHHTIVQYCAFKVGFKTFYNYRILGDDVAIWNERVAKEYSKILNLLDVTISEAKSIVPENQIRPGISAEFAKRIFYNGVEYSAIPSNICLMAQQTFWSIPQLFEHLISRQIDVRSIPVSKIKSAYQLHDKQILDLCRCFHIIGVSRHDLLDKSSLIEYIPEFVDCVNYKTIATTRFNLLMGTAGEAYPFITEGLGAIRADLDESSGYQVPEYSCFVKIMQYKIANLNKVLERVGSVEITLDGDLDLGMDFRRSSGKDITFSDLEFLPILTLKDIKSNLTDRFPRKIRFSKYLAKLVANVKLIANNRSAGPSYGSPFDFEIPSYGGPYGGPEITSYGGPFLGPEITSYGSPFDYG